jgi:hypothetical protein
MNPVKKSRSEEASRRKYLFRIVKALAMKVLAINPPM